MKNIIIIAPPEEEKKWIRSFKVLKPGWELQSIYGKYNPHIIDTALVWNHPKGIFKKFKKLELICSLGAGVDHLLSDPDIPKKIKITRIVDPLLSFSMTNYIILAVLQYHRKMDKYTLEQKNKILENKADETTILLNIYFSLTQSLRLLPPLHFFSRNLVLGDHCKMSKKSHHPVDSSFFVSNLIEQHDFFLKPFLKLYH